MLQLRRYAALLFIGLLTVACGFAAQRLNQGSREALEMAGKELAKVPEKFGDWEQQAAHPLPADEVEMLQCAGSTHRSYRHRKSGEIVRMYIIVGPPGPTSVHNPEVCYSSVGYKVSEEAQRFLIKQGDGPAQHSFWKVSLHKKGPAPEQFDVAFAWNPGDGWVAPDHPRFAFGGKPLLYKLQLATSTNSEAGQTDDACRRFLQDFLPALDATLFDKSAG